MGRWLPSAHEVVREGLIVVGGALLAAFVVGHVPTLRQWIRDNWTLPPQQ